MFSDYNAMRQESNYKGKKNCKKQKYVETKQYVIKRPMCHCRIQRENLKKNLEINENENTTIQIYGV